MLAIGMNGEPLPQEHGFPARLVIPGLYGFISATKWITRMTLTTYDEKKAYWTERDWATDAPIKISSRIDTPKSFSTISGGETFIGGVAWAQTRGIGKVEVQVDGGAWQQAELGPDVGVRLLAPVVPPLDGRARQTTTCRCARPTTTARCRPTPRPHRSRRLQRPTTNHRHGRLTDQSARRAAPNDSHQHARPQANRKARP